MTITVDEMIRADNQRKLEIIKVEHRQVIKDMIQAYHDGNEELHSVLSKRSNQLHKKEKVLFRDLGMVA